MPLCFAIRYHKNDTAVKEQKGLFLLLNGCILDHLNDITANCGFLFALFTTDKTIFRGKEVHDKIVFLYGDVILYQGSAAKQNFRTGGFPQVAVIESATIAQTLSFFISGGAGNDHKIERVRFNNRAVFAGGRNTEFSADQIIERTNFSRLHDTLSYTQGKRQTLAVGKGTEEKRFGVDLTICADIAEHGASLLVQLTLPHCGADGGISTFTVCTVQCGYFRGDLGAKFFLCHWAALSFAALLARFLARRKSRLSSLVLKNVSSWGTSIIAMSTEVKPPL